MLDVLTVLVVIAVLLVLFVAAAAATHEGDLLLEAPADAADVALPAGPMQPEDVTDVRFGLAFRGYRMAEVDNVLTRLTHELVTRDARIGDLERALVDVVEPAVVEAEERFAPVEAPPVEVWTRPVQAVTWPGIAPAPAPAPVEDVLAPFGAEDFPDVLAADPAAADLPDAVETPASESPAVPDVPAEEPEVPAEEPVIPAEAPVPAEADILADAAVPVEAEIPAEAPVLDEAPTAPLGHPGEGFARPTTTNPPA